MHTHQESECELLYTVSISISILVKKIFLLFLYGSNLLQKFFSILNIISQHDKEQTCMTNHIQVHTNSAFSSFCSCTVHLGDGKVPWTHMKIHLRAEKLPVAALFL